ncbi:MAG TPA: BrxA/BrxB family bacilliredoxin [Luteibaculaceae bacterium]|nr:BrxA/BrxB family bacilliredoxin [Luteibaculaceae bacterium]
MYPADLVAPMKRDLTEVGFEELLTPDQVDAVLNEKSGTTLVVINSVCGCAAGAARPGIKKALSLASKKPNRLTTVFAGVDKDAVDRARQHMLPYPPSSPSMALFKNGQLVHFIERHHIEGRNAEMIAAHLQAAFEEFC